MTFFAAVPLAILNKENTHENTHVPQLQLQLGAEARSETTGCYWTRALRELNISSEPTQTWRSQARPQSVRMIRSFPCSRIISNHSQGRPRH